MLRWRYIVGLVLLALGVGFLLQQTGVLPEFGTWLALYWPVLLVVLGVYGLLKRPARPVWPVLLILLGGLLQARNLGALPQNLWPIIGAIALILIGIRILVPSRPKSRHWGVASTSTGSTETVVTGDLLAEETSFGAITRVVQASHFRGGRVNVNFASAKIDLRAATLAPEGADLEVAVSFGELILIVPPTWPIVLVEHAAFGGCHNRTQNPPDRGEAPALRIRCGASFGSVEIRN